MQQTDVDHPLMNRILHQPGQVRLPCGQERRVFQRKRLGTRFEETTGDARTGKGLENGCGGSARDGCPVAGGSGCSIGPARGVAVLHHVYSAKDCCNDDWSIQNSSTRVS